jgi:hypothetical protein
MRGKPSRLFRHHPAASYPTALGAFLERNPPVVGEVTALAVLHDADCPMPRGGPCDCHPEIKTMGEHQRGQAERN